MMITIKFVDNEDGSMDCNKDEDNDNDENAEQDKNYSWKINSATLISNLTSENISNAIGDIKASQYGTI